MPLYAVKDKQADADTPKAERLIRAARPESALKFVIGDRFDVVKAEDMTLYRLGRKGVEIEDADADAEPAPDPAPEPAAEVQQSEDGQQPQEAASMPEGWRIEPVGDRDEDGE